MEEPNFQYSSLTEENVAEIGKILNVSEVLVVSVTDLQYGQQNTGERYVSAALGTRLLGVEKAEVLWIATCSGTGPEVGGMLEDLAKHIAAAFPTKNG